MKMDYKISLDYDDYFSNAKNIKSKDLEVVGDSLFFKTDKASLDYLNQNNICYMLHEEPQKKVKQKLKIAYPFVFALLIVAFMIVMNHYRVSKITFSGDYPINDAIKSYLEEENQKLLFFNFHKDNYDTLSRNLRSTFYEYEWITVSKKGSTLYVNIEPTTTSHEVVDEGVNKNIIASKDGIIDRFYVFSGSSEIHEKGFVKKGDVLITANPLAKGVVLATTFSETTIRVNKECQEEKLSGNFKSYQRLKLFNNFNFNLFKKQSYSSFKPKEKKTFEIPFIFTIYEEKEYELALETYIYDLKTAKEYAKSVILDDFLKHRTLNEEALLKSEIMLAKEFDTYFEITILVKKLESIGSYDN